MSHRATVRRSQQCSMWTWLLGKLARCRPRFTCSIAVAWPSADEVFLVAPTCAVGAFMSANTADGASSRRVNSYPPSLDAGQNFDLCWAPRDARGTRVPHWERAHYRAYGFRRPDWAL